MKRYLLQFILTLPFIGYAVYSYAQTDPNLVLTSFPLYWKFQEYMWQIGYHMRSTSVVMYAVLIIASLLSFWGMRWLKDNERLSVFVAVIIVLLFAHNALSHDIFNYMFNAKMVLQYGLDPHTNVALDVPGDDWLRFMHNTHTPAPYGYGWTVLSLLPSLLGGGKFVPTYMLYKLFMLLGIVVLFHAQWWLAKILKMEKEYKAYAWLFFIHPLFLIETIGNVHNDVWMLAFAFLSFWTLLAAKQGRKLFCKHGFFAVGSFIASVSIKFATVVLLPVMGVLLFDFKNKPWKFMKTYWAEISAMLLFLPLLTARSQWFHPWYLIWSLSFVPLMRSKTMRAAFLGFSLSPLFRYIPYLLQGSYDGFVMQQEYLITWVGGLIFALIVVLISRLQLAHRKPIS